MQTVTALLRLGYHLSADGSNIRFRYQGPGNPSAEAKPLIEELRSRKAEALAALTSWDTRRAGELLVGVQARLKALLDGRPIPDMDLLVSSAYDRLAEVHDCKDWPAFLEAVAVFERAWRGICRH
jgi:hypothetical protein